MVTFASVKLKTYCIFVSSKVAVHRCSLEKLVWKSSEIHAAAVKSFLSKFAALQSTA